MNTVSTNIFKNFVVAEPTAPEANPLRTNNIGTESITSLIETNNKFEQFKRDFLVSPTGIALKPTGGFSIRGEGSYTLEQHAIGQASQRLGVPFFGGALARKDLQAYVENYPQHFAPIWNDLSSKYELSGVGGKEVLARTYNDNTVRAYMSDKFSAIDNRDMLQILKGYLDDQNGGQYKLIRPYIARDSMTIDVIFPNEGGNYEFLPKDSGIDKSSFGYGVRIQTGEIGNYSPKVSPMIQRTSCTNSIVVNGLGMTFKQQGNRQTKLNLLIAAIGDVLQRSVKVINQLVQAQNVKIPTLASLISEMSNKEQWSEQVTFDVVTGCEGSETLWGLVNGLTYAAHQSEGLNAEYAIALEERAGDFLFNPNSLKQYVVVR